MSAPGACVLGAAQAAPGLVNHSTSGPASAESRALSLDPAKSRYRRLCRSVTWAAHLHERQAPGARKARSVMVTLTYRGVEDWRPHHISDFLRCVRKWLKRKGHSLRYTWVAELQQRGAVHYHVLVWLPRGLSMPKPDKRGWWKHGMSERDWARNPVGYMVKYVTKLSGRADFPKGLRLHGSGGFSKGFERDARHWQSLPGWLREQVGVGERILRPAGGGFVVQSTGQLVPSPWRFHISRIGGSVVAWVREVFRYADPIHATGPFSRVGASSSFQRSEVTFA